MGLSSQRERHRPGQAAETESRPAGRRRSAENARFVVQLHHTQRRHFDLRLEVGGTLHSWAVPRGPSLDAEQKRLAVQVEDHPVDDAAFEVHGGSGHPGAVVVWDQGHWQPDTEPARGLAEGHLGFTLYGRRLHGRWSLIRTDMRGDNRSQQQWLLVKARDSWVRIGDVADDRPLSAIPPEGRSDEAGRIELLPGIEDLQLVGACATVPEGDGWLHEVNLDGYRMLIRRIGDDVSLLSRNGADWTSRLPHLVQAVRELRCRTVVLDAELIAIDSLGRHDPAALQRQMARDGNPVDTVALAFDLLAVDRRDLRKQPQILRKRELAQLMARPHATLRAADFFIGGGTQHLRNACGDGLDGIISRHRDAAYLAGRHGAWLRTRCARQDEFAVIGYTVAQENHSNFGSLLLARPCGERWQYAGRIDHGIDADLAAGLPARLKPRREPPPLSGKPDLDGAGDGRPVWVAPLMVVDVEYRAIADDGVLQGASLKAIRGDKQVADLQPIDELAVVDNESTGDPRARRALTQPEQAVFAKPPISKRQLADFYGGIAEWLMPGVRNRPLTLLRCPQGIDASCWIETHLPHGFPRSVHETRIAGRHGRSMKVFYIDDLDGLFGLVQMGTVEIHTWGASLHDIEHPDQLVFDLDPGPRVAWARVIAAARELRDHLQTRGLQSFVRTSGGTGLHVLVPLRPEADWPTAKAFAREVARDLATRQPLRYTDLAGERNRKGRVLINPLRNTRGASSVASYSPRARAGAPMATPLSWSELGRLRSPARHDYNSLPGRLARLRDDPWSGYLHLKQTLPESARETKL